MATIAIRRRHTCAGTGLHSSVETCSTGSNERRQSKRDATWYSLWCREPTLRTQIVKCQSEHLAMERRRGFIVIDEAPKESKDLTSPMSLAPQQNNADASDHHRRLRDDCALRLQFLCDVFEKVKESRLERHDAEIHCQLSLTFTTECRLPRRQSMALADKSHCLSLRSRRLTPYPLSIEMSISFAS